MRNVKECARTPPNIQGHHCSNMLHRVLDLLKARHECLEGPNDSIAVVFSPFPLFSPGFQRRLCFPTLSTLTPIFTRASASMMPLPSNTHFGLLRW